MNNTASKSADSKSASTTAANHDPKPGTEGNNTVSNEIKRIYNLIILDESGSMSSIYRAAITGVNETLQTIRGSQAENLDKEQFVSLITFDTGHFNQIYDCTKAEHAVDITKRQYRPDGGTPLYDAMGRAINELYPRITKEDIVLVTIITDGYENASREFNLRSIKALVERMKSEGWVFTYIGANQDVKEVSCTLSIDNCMAFEADEDSTLEMFHKESESRKRFMSKIKKSDNRESLMDDYFI